MTLEEVNDLIFYARCSSAAYPPGVDHERLESLGLDVFQMLSDPSTKRRGFMGMRDSKEIVIAIKGTASLRDAILDAESIPMPFHYGGEVPAGFLREFDELVGEVAKHAALLRCCPVVVTGHSLGGAVATYIARAIAHDYGTTVSLPTFGSPFTGTSAFVRSFKRAHIKITRVVHNFDIVPELPPIGYSHVGKPFHLDPNGKSIGRAHTFLTKLVACERRAVADFKGERVENHEIKNYIAALTRHRGRILLGVD
jgi:hypothetical protein